MAFKMSFRACAAGDVGVSIVTALELAFGVEKTGSARNKLALDDAVLWYYARLRTPLESLGKPIGALDMQIAAHTLGLNCVLVINNLREFERVGGA